MLDWSASKNIKPINHLYSPGFVGRSWLQFCIMSSKDRPAGKGLSLGKTTKGRCLHLDFS